MSANWLFKSFNIKIISGKHLPNLIDTFKTWMWCDRPKMSSLVPPSDVKGMKLLDREKFKTVFSVPVIYIKESSNLSAIVKTLKKYLIRLDNFKPIRNLEHSEIFGNIDVTPKLTNETKCAFLNPSIVKSWVDLDEVDKENLSKINIVQDDFNVRDIVLTFDNFKADEILKAILPDNKEGVTGFSKVGHIIHLNLRDHHLEYKEIIGEVLLNKIVASKTVVNKLNTIDNTYRNFNMEVLCGEENFLTVVKENKCSFEFDFSKVYWNSRLCTEHQRIADLLNKGDVLFDVFAGVGPFSIPAAKKKCTVYANDLNPDSYKWLNHNAKLNKIDSSLFHSYNLDGREFIKKVLKKELINILRNSSENINMTIHITMNLPAIAAEFLDVFPGILNDCDLKLPENFNPPIVYVYCFAIGETPSETAKKTVEQHLQIDLDNDLIEVSFVRNVSPNKEMMRVSFHLSEKFLFRGPAKSDEHSDKRKGSNEIDNEPQLKHIKL